MCFNYSTNIRINSDIKKSEGNYFAIICRFVAMATVDQYGACHLMASNGPRYTSGPVDHASYHLDRASVLPPGHDPSRAAARGAKKQPQQIYETKAKNQL